MNETNRFEHVSGGRFAVLAFLAIAIFAGLGARLWFLQVMSPVDFVEVVEEQRTREIITEAPRGRILDVNGRVLADTRESLVVTLDAVQLAEVAAGSDAETRLAAREVIYAEVATILAAEGVKAKVEDLERTYQRAATQSLKPVVVAEDVTIDTWIEVEERALAGFGVERRWVRDYPYGEIAAHIIGHVGEVRSSGEAAELTARAPGRRYQAGDAVGIRGIEATFESRLRGQPEIRVIELDAFAQVVGTREVTQEAVPGEDVVLTIDIDVQYAVEQVLLDELEQARLRPACSDACLPHRGQAGSIVALDVTTGAVAAMASAPSYDPNEWVFGIPSDQLDYLRTSLDSPFLNRAVSGLYPAGSTFKPVTAYAAVTTGARSPGAVWEDEGVYQLESCREEGGPGCRFQNAGAAVLGPVDLITSLSRSSDTYYYSLGETFWVERDTYGETVIQDTAELFGFGQPSGVQLPADSAGRLPDLEWLQATYGEDQGWFTGDNVNLSIGQGELLVTPIQLANAYATIASGGERYEPSVVAEVRTADGAEVQEFAPRLAAEQSLDPTAIGSIRQGLEWAVQTEQGTAWNAFVGFPMNEVPIAGKTGTAQVTRRADYSLFAAYAPALRPRYAVAAVLEESGFGGDAAAPAVRRVIEHLFEIEGVPMAPIRSDSGDAPADPALLFGATP